MLLTEKVERNIRVAWLTQQSIDGWVEIEVAPDSVGRPVSETAGYVALNSYVQTATSAPSSSGSGGSVGDGGGGGGGGSW